MKAFVQRVKNASVSVGGEIISSIDVGALVLLGVTHSDTSIDAKYVADKICELRFFEDINGKTNLSIEDVGGSVIVVSQFTLYADTKHGRRPGFSNAAKSEQANLLYEEVIKLLQNRLGADKVGTGVFGADMQVSLLNDGPFSLEIES
jgi:D-tyrosyl-tRNA(Tyr) deacylase